MWSANFSLDGVRIVTASDDGTARVWDVSSGAELRIFAGHKTWVYDATFSRDGARILTASDDRTARVWDVASGAELLRLSGHEGRVWSVAIARGTDDEQRSRGMA